MGSEWSSPDLMDTPENTCFILAGQMRIYFLKWRRASSTIAPYLAYSDMDGGG